MRSGPKTTFYYFIKELVIQSTDNKNSRLPKAEYVINQHIPYKKVFVFDQNNEKLGVMSKEEAIAKAQESNMDLVLIALDNNRPITKILDYGKFKYDKKKKQKANKEKQSVTTNREIRLTPLIGDNDLKTKAKKAREFILNGDRVKISVKFRGRERSRTDLGNEILDKFFAMVEDVAKVSKAATLQNDRFLDMYIEKDKKKVEALKTNNKEKEVNEGETDAKNEN
ncbi:translation initiation factor IF-3 [Metamycoplasma salivarium]|uniref:Translation initiation factor IF-3 n=2 Tax=Metamycoplasma salivarium TaxID=2124 RepID=A0A448ZZI3_METSV|nr:translation initiation factor IF-3 [Metamycoplasma salivarium]CAD7361453.1 translation initiation factor IF-3 [Metamycoplasma salivarium]VEU56649.1 translation initiation factor IF-3 [Metamycoplasma salivarium]